MTFSLSAFTTPAPTVAVEIAPRRVSAIALAVRERRLLVAAHAVEHLPSGAVVPALTSSNIPDRTAVAQTLTRVFDQLGARPRRVALIVPDSAAKVSFVRFDKVPARAEDLDQLVRWQVRKTAPFRIEDALVTYAPCAALEAGGREFVVALARRQIIQEYEEVCAAAGAHAGIVDLATFNVINAVLAAPGVPSADWLLVHVTPEYTTVAIIRGTDLIFFRNRPAEDEGSLADLVHQTAMYYEDRLGGGRFTRAILTGAGASSGSPADARRTSGASPGRSAVDQVRRSLEERLGTTVEELDPRQAAPLADRISATPELLDVLAPLVGVVLRDRDGTHLAESRSRRR